MVHVYHTNPPPHTHTHTHTHTHPDHCPYLSAVHLHVNLLTYFPSASSDPTTSISSYERVISKLRVSLPIPPVGLYRVFFFLPIRIIDIFALPSIAEL